MGKIELQGADPLRRKIGAMIGRGGNIRPLLVEIAEIMYAEVMANFAAHGRNPKWPALAPSTKKRYAKKGYSPEPTLDRTSGGLVSSIQDFVTATSAGVGTNKPSAAIHNFGGTINIYARSQKVYFRADEKTGEVGHRFVKKRHSNLSQWATMGDYTITMPQREFMKVSPAGVGKIETAAGRFLTAP